MTPEYPGTHDWADHSDLISFFRTHRNTPDDLYPSEARFVRWLASRSERVIDVGCAAGGFVDIWRQFRADIDYIGIDFSRSLLASGKELRSQVDFICADSAAGLPIRDGAATAVSALGWLHWEPRYEAALCELWRACRRWLFFDIRLLAHGPAAVHGRQRVAYDQPWDGVTATPYICVGWASFARLLVGLQPRRILACGHLAAPPETVEGIRGDICFAAFVLEKDLTDAGEHLDVCLDLPLNWPWNLGPVVVHPRHTLERMLEPLEPERE